MNKYRQILNLYLQNTNFMILAGVLLISALASKASYITRKAGYAEDSFTILFVVTLWLVFYLGLLIKRQFANHRASLLPGYRKPHLLGVIFISSIFLMAAVAWNHGLRLLFEITPDGIQGIYAVCFFVALLITYLGYLSVGRIFMYAYVVGLLLAINGTNIIAAFESLSYLKYCVWAASGVCIVLFVNRLLELKESDFEYHYLLSWPPKNYFVNQLKSEQWVNPIKKLFKIKEGTITIPPYPKERNIFARAFHWDYTDHASIKIVGVLIVMATPIYLLFMQNNPMVADFFENVYSNFLLLSVTPVFVTLGSHYKKLAYWGHDLLRPVTREQYMLERGIVLLIHLVVYWFIFIVSFALLPNIIFHPEVFKSVKFLGFLTLTWNFSLLITAWLAWLSCSLSSKVILFNGLILGQLVLFQFYFSATLSLQWIMWSNVVCLCATILFFKNAYLAWCQKEFT